jgi:gluconokinase
MSAEPFFSIVVMGVSGSGKSTLAEALARRRGATFVDADDHHPVGNRQKMAAGIPLDDADRAPWLAKLAALLSEAARREAPVVLACSALKRRYRDVLRDSVAPGEVRFLFLDVPRPLLESRLVGRAGHFFSPALLTSQLDTLEPPAADEAIRLVVGPHDDAETLVARAEAALRGAPQG